MNFDKIKSYAKINLALNITGKTKFLHKIESIISFVTLHDEIFIKQINSKKHNIAFYGKFSKNIGTNNTVFRLIKLLEKKKLLNKKKFQIKINKQIPNKAGLGSGSMNAGNILRYFIKKKIITINKKETINICQLIGSDVILGLNSVNTILNSKNEIKYFKKCEKIHVLIVKPEFGCSTKYIYSKVKKINKSKFKKLHKKMFKTDFLIKTNNFLEPIAFTKYPKLRSIKHYMENYLNPIFVRMTGSGSALVAYYNSKVMCKSAKIKFSQKYKNYWCIASKTI
tara:strand:+ start:69 stop:914 length:846 start_codon:yes stop_codon:yes gene_type:complete